MSTQINLYDTVRVNVEFRDWDAGDNGSPVDPDDVEVKVINSVGTVLNSHRYSIEPLVVVRTGVGTYYYDWSPSAEGSYTIDFIGYFPADVTSVVSEAFTVGESAIINTLVESQELVFMADITPLYADPDEFFSYYGEANRVEVVEFIHRFSLEVDRITGGALEPPAIAYEYVRAATLCSLSRIYEYGTGNQESITLGDLVVSSQSYPRQKVNRTNASTWCELAAVLRTEMLRAFAGMKSVVKGSAYCNPMPERKLRSPYHKPKRDF